MVVVVVLLCYLRFWDSFWEGIKRVSSAFEEFYSPFSAFRFFLCFLSFSTFKSFFLQLHILLHFQLQPICNSHQPHQTKAKTTQIQRTTINQNKPKNHVPKNLQITIPPPLNPHPHLTFSIHLLFLETFTFNPRFKNHHRR